MENLKNKKLFLLDMDGTIYLGEPKANKMEFVSSERKRLNTTPNYSYSWQKACFGACSYFSPLRRSYLN